MDYIDCMGALAGSMIESDEALVDGVIGSLERPPEVLDVSYELGEDSDGKPEIWLWVSTGRDQNPSAQKVARLNAYTNLLRDSLLDKGVKGWPHVRIHEFIPRIAGRSKDAARK